MGRIIAFVYGLLAYVLFLGAFLYAIGFVTGIWMPKTIDSGIDTPIAEALLINLLLMSVFAIQHSVMARPTFKKWWTQFVPVAVERSLLFGVDPRAGIGRAAIGGVERLSGTHIYAALGTVGTDGRRNWISTASVGGRAPNLPDLASKVTIAPEFLSNARALITPGTTLVLTDAPVSDRTQSAPGFNILTTQTK